MADRYERAYSEKNKNTSQTAVGKVWKKMQADFRAADELDDVVTNERKTFSFTSKSKVTDFWSEAVQKIKSKVANKNYKSGSNWKCDCK